MAKRIDIDLNCHFISNRLSRRGTASSTYPLYLKVGGGPRQVVSTTKISPGFSPRRYPASIPLPLLSSRRLAPLPPKNMAKRGIPHLRYG
jgi:hypothetical protein